MKCPFCNHPDTQVIDSRISDDGESIRRRRQCPECTKRFTTYERAELVLPVLIKKNGTREDYLRAKLKASINLALRKRPISATQVDELLNAIEDRLRAYPHRELDTNQLGEWVMEHLRGLDIVGYIRFASVYKSFADLQSFSQEIARLTQPGNLNKPTSDDNAHAHE